MEQIVPAKKRPAASQAPSLNLVCGRSFSAIGLERYLRIELPGISAKPWEAAQASYDTSELKCALTNEKKCGVRLDQNDAVQGTSLHHQIAL